MTRIHKNRSLSTLIRRSKEKFNYYTLGLIGLAGVSIYFGYYELTILLAGLYFHSKL